MKKLWKSFLQSAVVTKILCYLVSRYILLVSKTTDWKILGSEIPAQYWDQNKPFILAFWHGRLLIAPYAWRKASPIHMLISDHRDGRYISQTISYFGIKTIVGSKTKGGAAALRQMIRHIQQGSCVGITPDGPQGPRMRASMGVVALAKMAKIPILPLSWSIQRRKVLKSWDSFIIPYPFSRGIFQWGEPIFVEGEDLQSAQMLVEQRLNDLTFQCDQALGLSAILPEDPNALTAKQKKNVMS